MTTITILGLGEAGRVYARGLCDAGADVRGHDPSPQRDIPGVQQFEQLPDSVRGADVVLSLVGGAAALDVAAVAFAHMTQGAVYGDLNTAAPQLKQRIAASAERREVAMADVAVLAPVLRAGHRTELLASGPGATALARLLIPFDVPVAVLDAHAGEAARLRLLRSVFMKGLAALVIEGTAAARGVGAEEWLCEQMARELGPDGRALVDRLIEGTYHHAVRRRQEVSDAVDMLEQSGEPTNMTRATLAWFDRIVDEQAIV